MKKTLNSMERNHNCSTCVYKERSVFDDKCFNCRWLDNGDMSGYVPAGEEKVSADETKPLSEYTDSELETELERRKTEKERDEWFDSFVLGDFYKITSVRTPSMFVIVRADEKLTTAYFDTPYISCTNVYDNNMGWISKPHINKIIFDKSKYVIEHLVNGYETETM